MYERWTKVKIATTVALLIALHNEAVLPNTDNDNDWSDI